MAFRCDTPDPRQRRGFSSRRAATGRADRGEMLMASQTELHHAFDQRHHPPTVEPRPPHRPQAAVQTQAHLGDTHPPAARGPHARSLPVQHRHRQQTARLRSRPPARSRRPPRRWRPPAHHHRSAEDRPAGSVRADRDDPRDACGLVEAEGVAGWRLAVPEPQPPRQAPHDAPIRPARR